MNTKNKLLSELIKNNWNPKKLSLCDGDDVYKIVSDDYILYVYYYNEAIEISVGENLGTQEKPDIDPHDVWELRASDFVGMNMDQTISKFHEIYTTKKYY